jgi:hypothetical protein
MMTVREATKAIGLVFGAGGMVTVMSGPGCVRLTWKQTPRSEWQHIILTREKAAKLAAMLQEAADR